MKYWERYILIALFITALPSILYESIRYYNKREYDKFFDWFKINVEYEWNCFKNNN